MRYHIDHVMETCRENPHIDVYKALETLFLVKQRFLPKYLPDKYRWVNINHEMGPGPVYTKQYYPLDQRLTAVNVPLKTLYGSTWLFDEEQWIIDGRPIPDRLARICLYIINRTPLLPIPADKLEENVYIVGDGNHRIYTAYLMGLSEVPLEVDSQLTLVAD